MERLNQAINKTIARMNNNQKEDFIYDTLMDYYEAWADEEETNMFIDEILGTELK